MAKIKDKNKELIHNKLLCYKKLRGEWKETIDKALVQFEGDAKETLFKWYFIEHREIIPICMNLYISQRTFFSWRDEIITAVMIQAAYDKLIKP